MEYDFNLLEGLLISLALDITTHIVAIAITYIVIRRRKLKVMSVDGQRRITSVENRDASVERLICGYANMAFIGVPLAYGIYGDLGVFYVTGSIIAFNIFMWTHGVIMISGSKDLKLKDIMMRLRSPAIIAIVVGFIFFIFQIKIPNFINKALGYVGNINTPLAMLIAGATIAKTDIFRMFTKNLRNYYMVFIKLLLIPLVCMLLFVWLPVDETVKKVAIMMAATPSTTVGTILTIKYRKNSILAAEILAMTTVLCILTIPLIIKITELLM
jgi:predicted permease